MIGKVSRTQVRRVSCTPIPDQVQNTSTIIKSAGGYLFDDMRYLTTSMHDRPIHGPLVAQPASNAFTHSKTTWVNRMAPPCGDKFR